MYCLQLWRTGDYDVVAVQQQFEVDFKVNFLTAQILSTSETMNLIVKLRKNLIDKGLI